MPAARYAETPYASGGRLWGGHIVSSVLANAWPSLEVACAFASDPAVADPLWLDISERVLSFSIRRGKSQELARNEAGTADLELDNRDNALTPQNSDSPYWPNIRPMRRIRISARWSYTTYHLFTGYVERWVPGWDTQGGSNGTVTVQAVDAFKVFALKKITQVYAAARSDVRIATVLSLVGWPATDQLLDVGLTAVQVYNADKQPALEAIQQAEEAEGGAVFMRGDGVLIFLSRLNPSLSGLGGGTFGDIDGELPYTNLGIDYGDDQIWNEMRFTGQGLTEQVLSDPASIATYLPRTLTKTGLLLSSDVDVLAFAQYQLSKLKDPILRFPTLTVNPALDPAQLWPRVLGIELGTSLTVRRRPPDVSGTQPLIEKLVTVQGISHDVIRGEWTTSYSLGEPDIQTLWQLDSPTKSQLDSTTKLSY